MTMFGAIRRRIQVSPATAIATLALVFAMSGGAYAASKYLITSTKQISPKVLKSLKGNAGKAGPAGSNGTNGAPGATGPAGPAGPAGGPGTQGIQGEKGTDGTNGESVTNTKLEPGSAACSQGGAEFKVGTGKATHACNGVIHPGETLPAGASETGTWSAFTAGEVPGVGHAAFGSISFAIPLAAPLSTFAEECGEPGKPACQVHYLTVSAAKTAECPGTATKPEATAGNLCVYTGEEHGTTFLEEVGSSTGGIQLEFGGTSNGSYAYGSWAVTA